MVKLYRHRTARTIARTSGEIKCERTKDLDGSKPIWVSMPHAWYEKSGIVAIDIDMERQLSSTRPAGMNEGRTQRMTREYRLNNGSKKYQSNGSLASCSSM